MEDSFGKKNTGSMANFQLISFGKNYERIAFRALGPNKNRGTDGIHGPQDGPHGRHGTRALRYWQQISAKTRPGKK